MGYEENEERESGEIDDSVPPQITTFASPNLIQRIASPIAWAPDAQAVEGPEIILSVTMIRTFKPKFNANMPRGHIHEYFRN